MTSNKAFMEETPHSPCEEGVVSDPFQDDNRDAENLTFQASGIDLDDGCNAGAMGGSIGSPTGISHEAFDDLDLADDVNCNFPDSTSNQSFRGVQDSQQNCSNCEKLSEDISEIKNVLRSLSGNHISQDAFYKIIEKKEDLKQGSSGCSVSKYQWKKSGVVIAGKRMDKGGLYPTYKKELNIISKVASSECAHENIALYITHHEEENCVILFTELCDFSLEEYIMNEVKLENECEPPTALDLLKQAVQGIKHLHGHDVVHNDVKPSNFLLKKRCKSCKKSSYVLKVIDFGLSTKLDSDRSTLLPRDVRGTRCFMAPECYTSPFCLKKSRDVFALGLVFHYVLTGGNHPFGTTENEIAYRIGKKKPNFGDLTNTLFEWCFQYLCNCKNGDCQPHCADMRSQLAEEQRVLAMDLTSRMIRKDPKMRPTIEEVEIHPFFWDAATKEKFYQVANDVVQKRRADAKFLKHLNEGIPEENDERRMSIKDLQLPAEPKYPQKKCGGEYVTQDYKDIKE